MTALQEAPPLAPGTWLAPGYEIVEHLSRNQALDVYDVYSELRDCRCVAKLLRPAARGVTRRTTRLRREGRLLSRLAHPHLVRCYEVIELEDGQPALILETLGGATLDALVAGAGRRMASADVCFLGMHVCSALHYLHGEGWLHLDLKPGNVIADHGRATVIDLSLARRPGRAPRRGYGTRGYLSPEAARGELLGTPTDVWGAGTVLFHAATGRAPFAEDGHPMARERAPRVRALRRLPAGLAAAIDAALEPRPEDRPPVGALADALDAAVGDGPAG
ncbi:MAG TPA: protein kinase [Solirubrobacteraceae bacterium]|nr:protein kinase [Solirubrobacteraceae bacterium]